jgi:hypothetical protein
VTRRLPLLLLLGGLIPAAGPAAGPALGAGGRPVWSCSLAAGLDTYVQRFPLATEDTTETITELTLVLGAEGRTPGRARHRWRLRPEISLGSELLRERLEAGYQFRPDSLHAALRLDASWQGRQYRGGTDYSLSSDTGEGRAAIRWHPAPAAPGGAELRAWGRSLRHRRPSSLEVDFDEIGGGLFWRADPLAARRWRLGTRLARRAYPDSAAIDRNTVGLEGELDTATYDGGGARLYHRSERRTIRDESARPSAWIHHTELDAGLALERGWLVAELRSEVWAYDAETSAYFDSWRLTGHLGYRGGDPLAWTWQLGLAVESLRATAGSPETYLQSGVRVGLESLRGDLSGSLSLEYGRRDYELEAGDPAAPTLASEDLGIYGYSDFNYWEIWLMGSWILTRRLSCDVLASYQPESHTEPTDDAAVAFGSLRFVWRW